MVPHFISLLIVRVWVKGLDLERLERYKEHRLTQNLWETGRGVISLDGRHENHLVFSERSLIQV